VFLFVLKKNLPFLLYYIETYIQITTINSICMQRTNLKFAWQGTIFAILVFACVLSEAQIQFSRAKPIIKEYKISSRILNEERNITIYKPPILPIYGDAVSPVIYTLDGEYHADFIVTLINYISERFVTMPPITVVGIENFGEGGIGRNRDMTPLIAKDSSVYKTSGGAEKFLQFIREEVFPLVEKDHKKTPLSRFGGSFAGWLSDHALFSFNILKCSMRTWRQVQPCI
jgi:enterochelin esterase-like enzyme